MTPESLSEALDFVEEVWSQLGISPTFLNIEYVGGEILLIDPDALTEMVQQTRERFSCKGIQVRDGVQSNLIGSPRRIENLYSLFEGRVGTSIDRFSGQRALGKVDGSNRYRTFQLEVERQIEVNEQVVPPAVLALDAKTLPFLMKELELAVEERRDLTLRPIFQGGSNIESVSPEVMGSYLAEAFTWWFKKGMPIHAEPFVNLLTRRCNEAGITDNGYCAWQSDCAEKSMSVEPNGDLYICQELADMGELRLGNALTKTFDMPLHDKIRERSDRLDAGCFTCPYFKSCQGGCLQQSLEAGSGLYGKTQWCEAWKALFAAMDEAIALTGPERLSNRINAMWGSQP